MQPTGLYCRHRWTRRCLGVLAALVAVSSAEAAAFLGPTVVIASKDGKTLFVANADAHQVAVVDAASRKVVRAISVPAEPSGEVLSPDGTELYVTCAAPKSIVAMIEAGSGNVIGSVPVGHTAIGPAVAPDGKRLYVCNRFHNNVSVIDLDARREIARVPVIREPVAAVVTPDGKSVFVINHLPLDRSPSYDVAASVTAIDTASHQTSAIRLPNGSSSVRGVCVSPDGRYLYVVHILAHYQMPATQLERGWMNTNAMSIIDARTKTLVNTVLLDDVDLGAANPWGVTTTADGKTICVSHAGTHEISVIDAAGLLDKLAKIAAPAAPGGEKKSAASNYGSSASATAADVPHDLAFLVGLRQRITLDGNGPRGLVAVGSTVYVAEYFADALGVVDLNSTARRPVSQLALGPPPAPTIQRRGEMLFHDAGICFQHWQSCASCHPDARVDGFNWDLTNDGLGNPKNTRSMLLVHQGGPAMWLGVRESATAAVRSGITHILFAVRPEEDAKAIDEYLKSLKAVPSPNLVDGHLSAAAERGKKVFFDHRVGCGKCHPEPIYCDKGLHDMGSAGRYDKPDDKFNTPRLVEAWRTAPYMHDGQYLTIKELLVRGRHGLKAAETRTLSAQGDRRSRGVRAVALRGTKQVKEMLVPFRGSGTRHRKAPWFPRQPVRRSSCCDRSCCQGLSFSVPCSCPLFVGQTAPLGLVLSRPAAGIPTVKKTANMRSWPTTWRTAARSGAWPRKRSVPKR